MFTKNPLKKSKNINKLRRVNAAQHRRLFRSFIDSQRVNKQYCFVSDAWRKYLRFVRESIYSEKRWLQISTNCCGCEMKRTVK
ncbi:MAG: hypothetical protein DME95_09125 [Verrucomicrobia bacterium]|nr:MAG: hypothetical protein DME95_09125 [Verrucomicrobiota bacterium]